MIGMQREDLALRLARRSHISKAAAADQLDAAVHQILRKLRSGKQISIPGLGVLVPGRTFRLRKPPVPSDGGRKGRRRGGR